MGLGKLFQRHIQVPFPDGHARSSELTVINNGQPWGPRWNSSEYQGFLGLPGAWRAATLLSDLVGGLPWTAYRQRAGNPVEVVRSPLLEQPNPPDTRMTSFGSLALDLLMHGNGVGVYTARNREGYPTACVPVDIETVGVRRAREGEPLPVGTLVYDINGRTFQASDVLHIKGPSKPGALRGMGVIENHLETLTLARDLQSEARNVSQHGVPTGKLTVTDEDADEEDLTKIKNSWMRAQRERTVAVLNATTDFEPLSWNPTETQLIEARKFSMVEIANIFGIDPSWLGAAQSSRVYSNIEQEAINLVKFSVGSHITRFEQTLALAFPYGTWVKANLDALLRADTLTRYQAHEIGIRAGFLLDDEARELEDRPPLTAAQRKQLKPPPPAAPPVQAAPDTAVENPEGVQQ